MSDIADTNNAYDNDSNDGHFLQLLNFQVNLIDLDEYVSELHTIQQLHDVPQEMRNMLQQMFFSFMSDMNAHALAQHDINKALLQSADYRQQGNQMFKQGNRLLQAANLYTKAIMCAPAGSEALALAFANRAQALQSYGYFKAAYDDCQMAAAYGYPKQQMIKLVARQATCASKLGMLQELNLHLMDLKRLDVGNCYTNVIDTLTQTLEELMSLKVANLSLQTDITAMQPAMPVMREQTIIETKTCRGRYMVTSKDIAVNELVMRDRAIAFVPINHQPICQCCANFLLIPYPCSQCHGKVIYCSLKCMLEDKRIHMLECHAYKCELVDKIGIGHLGMRIVITEMPQLVQQFGHVQNAKHFWSELTNNAVKDHTDTLRYGMHHLDKMPIEDLLFCSKVAELLAIYLVFYTEFCDMLQNVRASREEWQLITASLILRRMGQCMANSSVIMLMFMRSNEFPLLCENLWQRPAHLKAGHLCKFSFLSDCAAAYFPYLSICNHSCEHSFNCKFSGNTIEVFSRKSLKQGEELYNSYLPDYRKTTQKSRREKLDSTYHFACKCSKCLRPYPDQEYEQFHRYKCVNKKCRKVFVPRIVDLPNLEWWELAEKKKLSHWFLCTHCGHEQNYSWLQEFASLISSVNEFAARSKLYKLYEALDEYLVETHAFKLWIAQDIVSECYNVHFSEPLQDFEFTKLADIVRYQLKGVAEQAAKHTLEYIVHGTYLLDFIALRKVRCHLYEVQSIVDAMDRLSNELKPIYMNYFEDFVRPNLLS